MTLVSMVLLELGLGITLIGSLPHIAALGGLALVVALVLGYLLTVLFQPIEYSGDDEAAEWN